jgi:hypothetical protein
VQAALCRVQRAARFVNNDMRQFEFLFGSGIFRFQGCLTGFRRARRIIRIRTKSPGRENAG